MNHAKTVILSTILSLTAVVLQGQVVRLDDPDQFSEDSRVLAFRNLGLLMASSRADPGAVFDRWGVRLRAFRDNRLERVGFPVVPPAGVPSFIVGLRHVSSSSETDGPLAIDLAKPAFRAAVVTHTQTSDTTLRAFTPDGELLGSVRPDLTGDVTFLGVETSDPRGIGLLVLSNGEADPFESVSSLRVEYLQAASGFTVFVPQVGFGALGDAVLDTQLDLVNLSNRDAEATIFLIRSDGEPMNTPQAPSGEIPVTLDAFGSASFVLSAGTTLDAGVRVGYARIESSHPVEATALYTTRDLAGALLGEAGIASAIEQFVLSGFAEKRMAGDRNTGLAVVNPGTQSVEFTVVTDQGSGTMTLEPGAQRALFLDELIPEFQGQDFSGGLLLRADRPVVVSSLRTRSGVATASVPLGGLLQQLIH